MGNFDHATSLEGLRKRPLIRDTMPADVDECSNCIGATTGGVLTSRTFSHLPTDLTRFRKLRRTRLTRLNRLMQLSQFYLFSRSRT